jgi:hypothetical protein
MALWPNNILASRLSTTPSTSHTSKLGSRKNQKSLPAHAERLRRGEGSTCTQKEQNPQIIQTAIFSE